MSKKKKGKKKEERKEIDRVGAIILDKAGTHFLMGHQVRSQKWGVPKGKKDDPYEDLLLGMYREVREETGLNLALIQYRVLAIHNYPIYKSSSATIFVLQTNLRTSLKLTPPLESGLPNHEVTQLRWTTLKETGLLNMNQVTKKALQRTFHNGKLHKHLCVNKLPQ